ncbi:MAG: hypothetical protein V1918_09150 [Planctomycetota bacterium]
MVRTIRKMAARFSLGVGKMRRLTTNALRNKHVKQQLKRRRGHCLRCGACCRLLFKCPLLKEHPDGTTSCRIHRRRPGNCRVFPLDERDLRERDELMPLLPCGYFFTEETEEDKKTA